jgi:hypothetical protein
MVDDIMELEEDDLRHDYLADVYYIIIDAVHAPQQKMMR